VIDRLKESKIVLKSHQAGKKRVNVKLLFFSQVLRNKTSFDHAQYQNDPT
jgi:hypothetical protein